MCKLLNRYILTFMEIQKQPKPPQRNKTQRTIEMEHNRGTGPLRPSMPGIQHPAFLLAMVESFLDAVELLLGILIMCTPERKLQITVTLIGIERGARAVFHCGSVPLLFVPFRLIIRRLAVLLERARNFLSWSGPELALQVLSAQKLIPDMLGRDEKTSAMGRLMPRCKHKGCRNSA